MRLRPRSRTIRLVLPLLAIGLLGSLGHAQDQAPPVEDPATDPGLQPTAEPGPESQPADLDPEDLPDAIAILNTGDKISGKLVSQDSHHVVLLIGKIPIDLPAEQVLSVDIQPTVAQQYQNMRLHI